MVNKPKIQGTAFETLTVNKLNEYGFKARRLAEGGSKDEGDIECEVPFSHILPYPRVVLEAKHRANLNVEQYECCPEPYYDITFSMSSQLWFHFRTNDISQFLIGSVKLRIGFLPYFIVFQ